MVVAIHLMGAVTFTGLSKQLYADQSTITRNLKLLERRGLVVVKYREDRRRRLVSLSAEGEALLAQALPLWAEAQAKLMSHFGQRKWQTLLTLLTEVTTVS